MNGTVVFDLDYTLMDTTKFKDAMAASLADCGVGPELFWETYEATSKTAEKICDYDPSRHAEMLKGRMSCSREEMLRRVDAIVSGAPAFLFPGAVSVLRQLRSAETKLVLFTHGNAPWQERKVARAGLTDLFDRLIFAPASKESYVAELKKLDPPVIMVNDNGQEIDDMAPLLPGVRWVAVRGPKPLPADPSVPVCGDMEEVYKAVIGG